MLFNLPPACVLFNIKLRKICGYRLTDRRYCATGGPRVTVWASGPSLPRQGRPPERKGQMMSPCNERLRSLRHRFVALIAVSAMTLGIFVASAAPSRADSDSRKLMTFLFGAAVIAMLAHEMKDKDKDDEKPVVVTPEKPRGQLLPAACAIDVQGMNSKKAYTASCLRSYGFGRLPGHCAVSARVYGQAEWLYPAKCMREAGFRTK
jgi:hypothetical protein